MKYNFCRKSGLQLPGIALGLWHNFGDTDDIQVATKMIYYTFDRRITHFDLANNYEPPPANGRTLSEVSDGM